MTPCVHCGREHCDCAEKWKGADTDPLSRFVNDFASTFRIRYYVTDAQGEPVPVEMMEWAEWFRAPF